MSNDLPNIVLDPTALPDTLTRAEWQAARMTPPPPEPVGDVVPVTYPDDATAVGDWAEHAACRGVDPNVFHPVTGNDHQGTGSPDDHHPAWGRARLLCAGCVVRPACLSFALDTGQREGMWGGLTPRARRRLRTSAGMAPPPPIPEPLKCCPSTATPT